MDIISFAALGVLAGGLAALVMGVRTFSGLLMDIILGVFGAITGGIILSLMGLQAVAGVDLYSIALAATGAALWIGLGKALKLV